MDLENALITSDNIYFAQNAIDAGADAFTKGLKHLGLMKRFRTNFRLKSLQSLTASLIPEILLGDTGYGQGQMLMSPLHLAADYTAFVTDGNLVKPTLIKDGEKHRKSGISKWYRKPMPKKSQKG